MGEMSFLWYQYQLPSLQNIKDLSGLSSNYTLALSTELSKFTVSGTNITAKTEDLTDLSGISDTEELENDIMSYTNKGDKVDSDAPDDYFGIIDCYPV